MATVRTNQIFAEAKSKGVRPRNSAGGTQEYTYHSVFGSSFKLINSASFGAPSRPFLLASNTLNVNTLSKLLSACRSDLISIGFAHAHAQEHEKVFVVGRFNPDILHQRYIENEIEVIYIAAQVFEPLTAEERKELTDKGIRVAVIGGDLNGREITTCLKDIFADRANANVTYFS